MHNAGREEVQDDLAGAGDGRGESGMKNKRINKVQFPFNTITWCRSSNGLDKFSTVNLAVNASFPNQRRSKHLSW